MSIDNDLYNRTGDIWWNESQPLNVIRHSLNPGRMSYIRAVLQREQQLPATGQLVLDIGCGGGLLAEEVAGLGLNVTGVDPSESSLATARSHAAQSRLTIDYRSGSAEALPFPDASFDIVYCCDVLEHVEDIDAAIREAARVLKPGGIYLYDTINRTFPSKLVYIKLFQDWRWTNWMPPNLHVWAKFIKPSELLSLLARYDLAQQDLVGLTPVANPLQLIRLLRRRKRGAISFAEFGRGAVHRVSKNTATTYMGYARKRAS